MFSDSESLLQWLKAVLVAESTPCLPTTPFFQEMLERGHARLEAPSCVAECYIQGVLLLLPQSLPQTQEKGFLQALGADDMPGPGLMLGARCQVGDDHLYSLQFLVLGRNRAHLIGDLVAFHWNILPFHIRDVKEDVRATISRGDEAVALGPAEAFTDSFVDRAL